MLLKILLMNELLTLATNTFNFFFYKNNFYKDLIQNL